MSTALHLQQQAFVEALFARTHEGAIAALGDSSIINRARQWQRGLLAYRSTGAALAVRALQGAYPVCAQLLGGANFAPLARELWHRDPPLRGDIAQWGGGFAGLLQAIPALATDEPYLADVARVEWLLHRAATAADSRPEPASLALLTQHDPAALTLVLAPGTASVRSEWPVGTLVLVHTEGGPTLDEAATRLHAGLAETVVVWREGLQPRVRHALPGEADLLACLQERGSLADSLDAAPQLDFAEWLAQAVRSGLVVRAEMT
jgi:hypothetical protein